MAVSLARWGNDLHTGKKSYAIVTKRGRWFIVSALLMALAVSLFVANDGIHEGMDFKGGSKFDVTGVSTSDTQPAKDAVATIVPGAVPTVQVDTSLDGSKTVTVKMESLDDATALKVQDALASAYGVDSLTQVSTSVVGPTWGADVSSKAVKALVIFLILVAVVMAVYFRAWRMAVAALIALAHDLIFTVGIYAATRFDVTPATVIGFLTILGFSLYDTVVVFDKVRENPTDYASQKRYTYAELANLAVNQTLVRSINTSVVALLPVASILFIGGFAFHATTLKDISLALFVGLAVGTYSSIFVATPFEVALRGGEQAVKKHTAEVLALRAAQGIDPATPAPVVTISPGEHRGFQAQPRSKRRS
jgi:preprotein translocase subunit SecF